MINKIICRVKGHTLIEAGTCPYTGSTYNLCTRCLIMIPIQLALQINKLKNDEVLERLGSDYDENGIPYWESK